MFRDHSFHPREQKRGSRMTSRCAVLGVLVVTLFMTGCAGAGGSGRARWTSGTRWTSGSSRGRCACWLRSRAGQRSRRRHRVQVADGRVPGGEAAVWRRREHVGRDRRQRRCREPGADEQSSLFADKRVAREGEESWHDARHDVAHSHVGRLRPGFTVAPARAQNTGKVNEERRPATVGPSLTLANRR